MNRAMTTALLVVLYAFIVAVPSARADWVQDGVAVCTAVWDQEYPQIISDGAGGAIVTWMDHRSDSWDIYAQRVNASGDVQWTADGIALCGETAHQGYPAIVSDGPGGAIVAWEDLRNGTWDIYAQRVNASGAVQWTTDGIPLCTAMVNQQSPKITSDGAGGAIVTWDDYRSGSNWDVYTQRVNASGAVQWMGNGVALCTATREQSYLMIVSDGAGGAIVSWHDLRSGNNYDIYAQKADASGAVQWTMDGIALCTATGDQGCPTIVADGAGGAIVTWMDHRGSYYDIYAQKVNTSGFIQWTADGVTLCAATLDQYYPTIASDGWGGAIVTWYDNRSGDSDIYALRVDANGFPVLTVTDVPAAPVELRQNYPNPFNPTTTVSYFVPEKCGVTLKIYDISGKCIAYLVDMQQEKGSHVAEWNGKDEKGNPVASGIYFYRLTAGDQLLSKKMVLLR